MRVGEPDALTRFSGDPVRVGPWPPQASTSVSYPGRSSTEAANTDTGEEGMAYEPACSGDVYASGGGPGIVMFTALKRTGQP